MHSLANIFVETAKSFVAQDLKLALFPVKIVLAKTKLRILYFDSESKSKEFIKVLEKTAYISDVFDYYNIIDELGKGQFGVVKLANHKLDSHKVAIKTVKKEKMSPIEITQQRREIEVLKMCQHNNIVKLIDLFENSEYYYIVMEYMEGNDMFDFLQRKNFELPEEHVKELMIQLIIAVRYLHSFGIVHRDLKLENIMMSSKENNAIPKLVDFGLSKIIGPNEKASEPFGTVGYVAPEVLKRQPYSYSCDVWSIGCIVYALIAGSLPFDSNKESETKRLTMEEPLVFVEDIWKTTSKSCKDLLTKFLIKDQHARITLDHALKHPFFDSVRDRFIPQSK